jgi:hypothetical protein
MDKRKIEKFKETNDAFSGAMTEQERVQTILNSQRVNEAFL